MSKFRTFIQMMPVFLVVSCVSSASQPMPIDSSVSACDNFYQHVCGGWLKQAKIPAGQDSVRLEENEAQAANEHALRELLEGTDTRNQETDRLRTFFASCLAEPPEGSAADRKTLASWSQDISDIKTRAAFWSVWQNLQKAGINALLSYSGEVDWSNWKSFQGHIHQGRLGLNPAFYSDKAEKGRASLASYQSRIEESLASFQGKPKARRAAANIVRIETALAAASIPRQDTFDPKRTMHPMKRSELEKIAPSIPWVKYFTQLGNPAQRPVNVTAPAYIKALHQVLAKESVEDLRDLLLWQWLDQMRPYLPTSLATDPEVRVQQCRVATIKALGVELSRQFALTSIGPDAKAKGQHIANEVRQTMADSATAVDWLSPASRQGTQEKLAMTDIKVGFPDQWPSVGTFPLGKDTFLDNVLAAQSYEQQRSWARAQKARDRSAWEMKVYPDVAPGMAAARLMISNGFPDVLSNSIILTAASIQKPRFDPAAPIEVQYGGFGSLVAHELVHVLEYPQFDKTGAPHELWTEADSAAHQNHRTGCLTRQAEEFKVNPLTLDENVADLSGIKYAYQAMTKALPAADDPDARKAKAQGFFYAYAQHWCTKEAAGERLDQRHAPAEFRVNGPLSNVPEFAEAFACKEGHPMARPAAMRCSVW